MPPQRTQTRVGVSAIAALALMATILAGCTSGTAATNQAPHAALDADRTTAWAGQEFTFDAQASRDPDGNVTSWAFDFGDGTHTTVSKADDARVKHVYGEGGEYAATVTVTDDGRDGGLEKKSDSASVHVAVNDKTAVPDQVVYAGPLNATPARMTQAFAVHAGAQTADVTLEMRSVLVAGSSDVRIRIVGVDDSVLAEKSVTLTPAENQTVELSAALANNGDHRLEIVAQSGGIEVSGEIRVMYKTPS
jgi:PKD repeat protein